MGDRHQSLSPAVDGANLKFISGQIALNPSADKKELVGAGDVTKETTQAITNLKTVLENAGSSLGNVCKVNIFIMNMQDYAAINEVYIGFFGKENLPARAVVQVANLPMGALVELECVAY